MGNGWCLVTRAFSVLLCLSVLVLQALLYMLPGFKEINYRLVTDSIRSKCAQCARADRVN